MSTHGDPPSEGTGATTEFIDSRSSRDPAPEAEFGLHARKLEGYSPRVVAAEITEALSETYEVVVEICTEEPVLDLDAMLGERAVLTLVRGPRLRRFCGVVRSVQRMESTRDQRRGRLWMVPALWVLSQRRDSRIFQNLTAIEIVSKVLQASGRRDLTPTLDLRRTYPKREYCVQYRETDLDFVKRLLEEEGVTFYFRQEGDAETLVLTDSATWGLVPTLDRRPVPSFPPQSGVASVEVMQTFTLTRDLRPTGAATRDYDFTRPAAVVDLTRSRPQGDGGARAIFDFPGDYTLGKYNDGTNTYTAHDGARRAELLHLQEIATEQQVTGTGNVTGMLPGRAFELSGHELPDLDARYLVTRVKHQLRAPEVLFTEDTKGPKALGTDRYRNDFECVPATATWVPDRKTPRPMVLAAQTATVTGPAGEEVHTDAHGRIKVQFHWDRLGKGDDTASCWIRVAQTWAGAGWGTMFIPRVGMEVVVHFLEGNPDRPIVTGCVYNGENATPYTLPDHKTRSTLRSNSSPGGSGYNELRFEDMAGSEEIFLHAQRDLNTVVEHDHSGTVHRNQTLNVVGDRVRTVQGNESITIDGSVSRVVQGSDTLVVQKSQAIHILGKQMVVVDGTADQINVIAAQVQAFLQNVLNPPAPGGTGGGGGGGDSGTSDGGGAGAGDDGGGGADAGGDGGGGDGGDGGGSDAPSSDDSGGGGDGTPSSSPGWDDGGGGIKPGPGEPGTYKDSDSNSGGGGGGTPASSPGWDDGGGGIMPGPGEPGTYKDSDRNTGVGGGSPGSSQASAWDESGYGGVSNPAGMPHVGGAGSPGTPDGSSTVEGTGGGVRRGGGGVPRGPNTGGGGQVGPSSVGGPSTTGQQQQSPGTNAPSTTGQQQQSPGTNAPSTGGGSQDPSAGGGQGPGGGQQQGPGTNSPSSGGQPQGPSAADPQEIGRGQQQSPGTNAPSSGGGSQDPSTGGGQAPGGGQQQQSPGTNTPSSSGGGPQDPSAGGGQTPGGGQQSPGANSPSSGGGSPGGGSSPQADAGGGQDGPSSLQSMVSPAVGIYATVHVFITAGGGTSMMLVPGSITMLADTVTIKAKDITLEGTSSVTINTPAFFVKGDSTYLQSESTNVTAVNVDISADDMKISSVLTVEGDATYIESKTTNITAESVDIDASNTEIHGSPIKLNP